MVIELIGPAGAGKTTLLRALRARGAGVRAGVRVDRIHDMPLVLKHAARLAPVLVESLGRDARAAWSAATYLVRLNALLGIVTRENPGAAPAVVLDEGPTFILTRLAAFHERMAGRPLFESAWKHGLLRTASVLDAIVWLDAPDGVLARRIREREKEHRIKHASDAELRHFLGHYRGTYGRVVEEIAAAGATRMLRFDTSRRSTEDLLWELGRVLETDRG